MIGALDVLANEIVDLRIALHAGAGLNLAAPVGREFAGCAKTSRVRRTQARISSQSCGCDR